MSKGVSGSFQGATGGFPSGKALMYFGFFLAAGVFFVFVAFMLFLPVMVVVPQKFAICFIASLFALKGPANQLADMTSKERLPFTLGFTGCMVGTIYASMVLHSYFLSVIFLILQAGLFFYDIFWVFFTPVMVTVAKSFDAPIKLLFPTADVARPFSMLGLGDIVIPSIFVALALRFDVSRGIKNHYFSSAFLGYAAGITATIVVMNWFQAAQPALLYIVPGVMGFVAAHSLWNGEVKPVDLQNKEFNNRKRM